MNKSFFQAVAFMIGTVIGAGILGIPYVVQKSGIYLGLAYIVILGIFSLIINLYVGEVSLRTKGTHELTGYAEKFLGKWGKQVLFISLLIEIYGALTAYLLGVSESFSKTLGFSSEFWIIIYFILMGIILFRGIKAVKSYELIFNAAKLILIFSLILVSFMFFKTDNLVVPQAPNFVLPFGVILFSFMGLTAIPQLKQILVNDRKAVRNAIIVGSIIPIIVYALFALAVVGVTGAETSGVATLALGDKIGFAVILLGNVFAIFSMTTAFLAVALALIWIFHYDYGINKNVSLIITLAVPLLIALSGLFGFIRILGITGAVAGGVTMILCLIMFHRSKESYERKPEYELPANVYLSTFLVFILVMGIIATLFAV